MATPLVAWVVLMLSACLVRAAEWNDTPLPVAPAFYSVSIGRIRNVQADCFDFQRDDGKRVRVRLAGADCSKIPDRIRSLSETICRNFLETKPVWIFPCGCPKGGSGTEVWACVWTEKGWLSEVLVRAGYANRRTDLDPTSLAPPDPTGTTNKGPPPADGAFLATSFKPFEADVFEMKRDGKTVRVRLFDVTCVGGDPSRTEEAHAAASRLIGDSPVWVFPSCPKQAGEELRVRIWTPKGWLCHALVSEKLATRYSDPYKAIVESASAAPPTPTPGNTDEPPEPEATPQTPPPEETDKFSWKPVAITAVKVTTGGMQGAETNVFDVKYGVIRIAWNCKPSRPKSTVLLNLYCVDEKWTTRVSSHHVQTMKGQKGTAALRVKPGRYWLKLSCSADVAGIRVELAEPAQ